jgi:hypothetical protein
MGVWLLVCVVAKPFGGITPLGFKENVIWLGMFELLFFKDIGNLQGVWLLKE